MPAASVGINRLCPLISAIDEGRDNESGSAFLAASASHQRRSITDNQINAVNSAFFQAQALPISSLSVRRSPMQAKRSD